MTWIKNRPHTDVKNMQQKQTTLTGGKSVNPHPLGRPLERERNGRLALWAF